MNASMDDICAGYTDAELELLADFLSRATAAGRTATDELNGIFESLLNKVSAPGADTPFAEITDEDIDNLFND